MLYQRQSKHMGSILENVYAQKLLYKGFDVRFMKKNEINNNTIFEIPLNGI